MVTSGNSTTTLDDFAQEQALLEALRGWKDPVLAFSGGVDSSYLLWALTEVHGPHGFQAVLGVSASLAERQHRRALAVAARLGVRVVELGTDEGTREEYRQNLGDRCFFCKDSLFRILRSRYATEPLLDGTNADDLEGHRPGMLAAAAYGVHSPLAETGLRKAAIRRLSALRQLPTADLPASPCLASRFPAGTRVTDEGLRRIEAAEEFLEDLGFRGVRVRNHGDLARIELDPADIPRAAEPALAAQIAAALRHVGFRFVSLDLEGYRSGSGSRLADGAP